MQHLRTAVLSLVAAGTLTAAMVSGARANDLSEERKAKAWVYIQGYKGNPHNYCGIIATLDKDNGQVCASYKAYDSTHDKDAAEKYYICAPGYECTSAHDPK